MEKLKVAWRGIYWLKWSYSALQDINSRSSRLYGLVKMVEKWKKKVKSCFGKGRDMWARKEMDMHKYCVLYCCHDQKVF